MIRTTRPLAWLGALLLACAPLSASLAQTAAQAQPQAAAGYPDKPIRIVVPFGPGSATDLLTRGIARGLTDRLHQSVVVENRPGAGGNIGANAVARAAPDGYTLVMGTNGPFAANVSLYSKLPHDPLTDFAPIALMGRLPMMLVGNNDAATSLAALIAEAKAKPGSVSFGASNTTARVWVELLKSMAKVDVNTVLYSNVGSMITDLAGGRISYAFENVGPTLELIRGGKVRALAVTSPQRASFLPDVQTVAEAGLTEHELVVWFAMFAPAGTPAAIVERLNTEVNAVLQTAELRQLAEQIGMRIAGGTPKALADYHATEVANWRRLVEMTGVRID